MSDPIFVTIEQVLRAHDQSLRRYGGSAGIRDEGLLQSAVQQPLNDYFYGHGDLVAVAAAYAFHIAQAQAFLDGNKRTAITTAFAFLEQNGIATSTHTDQLYDAMIGIAARRLTKADLAQVFRKLFT